MKPFNLEAAKAGALLITRDGRKARFIAHVPECNDGFRVLAFIDGHMSATEFDDNGRFVTNDDPRDLFMDEEEKRPVVRWLWAVRQKTGPHIEWSMLQTFSTEQELEERMGRIRYETKKLEWSRTEFAE